MAASVPQSTALSEEYWSAVADHRLVVPYCNHCDLRFFPPARLCPHCMQPDWRFIKSSGHGQVITHTVVHRAPTPAYTTPYVLAVVEVDDQWTMLTHLIECSPEHVHPGMKVTVRFCDRDNGTLPYFAPMTAK